MHCPIDNETLVMTERSGVEIDYCPKCRGVWLDRGELDKIIERAAGSAPVAAAAAPPPPPREAAPVYRDAPPRYDDDDRHRKPYRKKESFLSDLFDF